MATWGSERKLQGKCCKRPRAPAIIQALCWESDVIQALCWELERGIKRYSQVDNSKQDFYILCPTEKTRPDLLPSRHLVLKKNQTVKCTTIIQPQISFPISFQKPCLRLPRFSMYPKGLQQTRFCLHRDHPLHCSLKKWIRTTMDRDAEEITQSTGCLLCKR